MLRAEQERFDAIVVAMREYESQDGAADVHTTVRKVNEKAVDPISELDLEYYIEGVSLEDFAMGLSIDRIQPDQMTEEGALRVIDEIFSNDDPDHLEYRMLKYVPAIEFFYRKPTGYIRDQIFFNNTPKGELIRKLRSDEDGPICL